MGDIYSKALGVVVIIRECGSGFSESELISAINKIESAKKQTSSAKNIRAAGEDAVEVAKSATLIAEVINKIATSRWSSRC